MHAVLIDGASTAYGMHAGEYGGWAAQLHRDHQLYNEQHRLNPYVVVNHALPGLTLPGINKLSLPASEPLVRMARGNAVRVLAVGLNEAKVMPGRETPIISLGRFATELTKYSWDSQELRVPTVYVGPQYVDETRTLPSAETGCNIEDDLLEEYTELIREQAKKDDMPFVDVRAMLGGYAMTDVLSYDGLHPNGLGHQIIHQGVSEAIDAVMPS